MHTLLLLLQKQFFSLFVLYEPKNVDQALRTDELAFSAGVFAAPHCRVQLLQSTASLSDATE